MIVGKATAATIDYHVILHLTEGGRLVSTAHDQARLDLALATTYDREPSNMQELDARLNEVELAIAGLQSTDDPSPIFRYHHDRLQRLYASLHEMKRRLPHLNPQ